MSTAYASTAELQDRYESAIAAAHVTDSEDTGSPDTDRLQESLDYAAGQINSYLAVRYYVPVDVTVDAEVDALLRNLCLDLAQVHLATFRQGFMPEEWVRARDMAVAFLERIRKGEAHLPTATLLSSTTSVDPVAEWGTGNDDTDESNRLFTRAQQDNL